MNFLNGILTFPGKIIANLLFHYLGIVWLIVLAGIICLLVFYFLYKKKEFFHVALILSSILLAFTPSTFKFASYDSKLFWFFISASAAIGFIYYFIDRSKELFDEMEQPISPLNRTTGGLESYQYNYLFLLLLIFGLAFYLRTFQIEKYPVGYSYWELNTPLDVIKYDTGLLGFKQYIQLFKIKEALLSNESPIVMGLAIPFYKIFGISLATGRYLSFVWGMLGLLFLFLYLREQFPVQSATFLISFAAVELVNVIFSRIGSFHITSFTYTVFVLYLLEIAFKQRKLFFSVPLAFLLGLATLGSIYLYRPTRSVMLIVIVVLGFKAFFRKKFLVQNIIPLGAFLITFSLALYIHTGGNLLNLWPEYSGYINVDKSTRVGSFINEVFVTLKNNLRVTFNRIVFVERAPDSLSKFKNGGLISGPVLCFIPFAIGYVFAGIRRERYFTLVMSVLIALMPAVLAGVPNAVRMLLFLSLLLILPGITLYLLWFKMQNLKTQAVRFQNLFPAMFIILLFSYNDYLLIDINSNMVKANSVNMPFVDSGFGDKRYSKFVTSLAREVNSYMSHNDVLFYYSNIFDENATFPNGTFEQLLIGSYKNIKKGGRLVWMNPFHADLHGFPFLEGTYFYKLGTALKLILDSDRDVKVIFIKPLADELGVYEGLKTFFPKSMTEDRMGEVNKDKYIIMTIETAEILDLKKRLGEASGRTIDELYRESRSQELKRRINADFSFNGFFLIGEDSKNFLKNNMSGDFDIMVDDVRLPDDKRDLFLLKGVHSVKVRPMGKEPFVAIDADAKVSHHLSAQIISQLELMGLKRSNSKKLTPKRWSLAKSATYFAKNPTHSFHYLKDGKYLYTLYGTLFNESDQSLLPEDIGSISRVDNKNLELILLRYTSTDYYRAVLYDAAYHKIKEFQLEGYPFDIFFGDAGEIYITYLNINKITIIKPDYSQEIWDTSPFADNPIWNGDVDKNGDIILLSGNDDLFVFDKNRNLYSSFKVDASWAVDPSVLRYGGGVIVSNGIIHVLDSLDNSVKSYDKSGYRLCYNEGNCSLFDIPANVKIDFMQKSSDGVVLLDSKIKRQILTFQTDKK